MSWFIDWRNAKTESEAMQILDEKIERYKKLLKSQPWDAVTEKGIKKVISELEDQRKLYESQAA